MTSMAAYPLPLHAMRRRRVNELVPEWKILDLAHLPAPSATRPAMNPLRHPLHQVLGVAGEQDPIEATLATDHTEGLDRAAKGHPIVRGGRLGDPVIPPRQPLRGGTPVLDHPRGAAGIVSLATVAQTRLISLA